MVSPCSVGEDWVFLALLGIIVAVISFCMDYTILLCNQVRGAIFSGSWYFFPVASIIWQIFFLLSPGPAHWDYMRTVRTALYRHD